MKKSKVDVIVGLQFGDEGKGKIINELAPNYDVIVRFQGGANSGHTIWKEDGSKVIFNVVPSGMMSPNILGVITQGVVINPQAFMLELSRLQCDIKDIKNRLYISRDIHLTAPYHILLDKFTEKSRDKHGDDIIGSTNRGNTPTYIDKVARRGITIADAISGSYLDFMNKYSNIKDVHMSYITNVLGEHGLKLSEASINDIPYNEYEAMWFESLKDLIKLNICNTVSLLHDHMRDGKSILLEGAQGTMLDIEYGTYPFVTSSAVTSSAAFALTGIPPQMVNKVFGVAKPYITRVGNGFFPTRIHDDNIIDFDASEHIVNVGKEFGSVTGRKRMIGWLDLPQLKYACMINGVTDIILMKCDVLSGLGNMVICTYYKYHDLESYVDVYQGSDSFKDAIMERIDSYGVLDGYPNEKLMDLISRINECLSDVITSPKISMVSMSATNKSVRI